MNWVNHVQDAFDGVVVAETNVATTTTTITLTA